MASLYRSVGDRVGRDGDNSPSRARDSSADEPVELNEPSEPPTTFQAITVTGGGIIKRTPRHLYDRQRRAGMGVFDLDAPDEDPPALLAIADLTQNLILVTSRGTSLPAGREPARRVAGARPGRAAAQVAPPARPTNRWRC